MTATTEQPAITAELELVVNDTNSLTIRDTDLQEAAEVLRPIAESIPGALVYAGSLVVRNEAEAAAAAEQREAMLANAKLAKETVNKFNNGIIERLFRAHRRWTAFRALFDPLETAAKQTKAAIIKWQEEEERKARAEQARLQAEADERARKEREKLEREAAKLKTAEKREERLEAAAAVVAPVVRVEAPKAAVSVQKRWTVERIDMPAFVAAVAADPTGMLIGFLEARESALARAKAANPAMTIPGVTFVHKAV
jgi:vacuolar-type H+-ATPase subunit I/STV1